MRLKSVTLSGITTYKTPVTVHLADMGPGLIAVQGPNGSGKTTLMEAIFAALYQHFPSREQTLMHYGTQPMSFIDLRFTLGDAEYQILHKLDIKRKKHKAYVYDGSGQALISSGRLTDVRKWVEHVIGKEEFFLASIFAAYKRKGNFLEMDPAKKKELFADLLGLDRDEKISVMAKERFDTKGSQRHQLVAAAAELEATAQANETVEQRLNTIEPLLAEFKTARSIKQAALAGAEEQLILAQNAHRRYEEVTQTLVEFHHRAAALKQRQSELEGLRHSASLVLDRRDLIIQAHQEYQRITEVATTLQPQHARLREREEQQRGALERQIQQIECEIAALDASMADLSQRRQNNYELLAREADILAAAEEVQRQDAEIAQMTEALDQARARETIHHQAEMARLHLDGKLNALDRELSQALATSQELAQVPCRGIAEFSGCIKIQNAVRAKETIPNLEQRKAALQKEWAESKADLVPTPTTAELSLQLKALGERKTALATITKRIPYLHAAKDRIATLTRDIQQAEARRTDLATQVQSARTQWTELRTQLADIVAYESKGEAPPSTLTAQLESARIFLELCARAARQQMLADDEILYHSIEPSAQTMQMCVRELEAVAQERLESSRKLAVATEEQTALEKEIGNIPLLQRTVQDLRHEVSDLDQKETETLVYKGTLEEKLRSAIAARARYQTLQQQIAEISKEMADWSHLHKAFGKNGTQLLEVSAAGPDVSALCNKLLEGSLDEKFEISICTQRPDASNKRTLDEFDIKAYNKLTGVLCSVNDLSGGEFTLINEAIGLALAIFNTYRQGQKYETLFRDETVSTLDPENAKAYVQMLRRAIDMGHFHQLIFVTHTEHISELADASLRISKGAIEMRA